MSGKITMPIADRLEVRGQSKTMVAIRTTTVKNERGERERLKAGVTFIHDPRHWLVRTYPELFRPDTGSRMRAHPRRQSATPARAARHATECPRVVLLDGSEPAVTVRLRRSARDLIRDQAFRARDGDEIGGARYAEPNTSELPAELEVERACGPGPRSRRAPAEFRSDIAYYVANENRANGEHERSVCWIGDWHCHPVSQAGLPSPADLLGWARALQAYGPERGLSSYVGLIVTAPTAPSGDTTHARTGTSRAYTPGCWPTPSSAGSARPEGSRAGDTEPRPNGCASSTPASPRV